MSEPKGTAPITCEYDNCRDFAEAVCATFDRKLCGKFLCRNHARIIDNAGTVCPDCLAAEGAVE